jgi:hypothetical protein
MARWISLLILVAVLPTVAQAQQREYEPSNDIRADEELVLVFVSSSTCVGARATGLHEAIRQAKLTISDRASIEGVDFRAVGVALDWPTADGVAYLSEFGKFDELTVGSNWFNLAAETMIWGDDGTDPTIPQLIVFRREIATAPTPSFGKRKVLKRVEGSDSIVEWVRAGVALLE